MSERMETFTYDDAIVRMFLVATLVWGGGDAGGPAGGPAARRPGLQLPALASFGRSRPLHTNAVIFAFAGNAIFAGDLLLDASGCSRRACSATASGAPLLGLAGDHRLRGAHPAPRHHQGKEYAELEWPIDIAIARGVGVFAVNFFGRSRRRERHMYVAIWFYIAPSSPSRMLHIFNNLVLPAARSRATRSTPACRTPSCSGGTGTTRSPSS
jgi:cytochrome c oxidase cbb3-type subunit I/II